MIHRNILKGFSVLLVSACLLAGCGTETEEPANRKNNTATEAEGTAAPEAAESPTPEPTAEPEPVEEFVELTDEEISELWSQVYSNYRGFYFTDFMVAYYKYIGLEELEVPVLLYYQPEEAEELFGGEWEQLPEGTYGEVPNELGVAPVEEQSWLTGTLTIARIEQELMYGDALKVNILGDNSVECIYDITDPYAEGAPWNPPVHPFTEYMRWLRHYGQYYLEDQGTYYIIESVHMLD